jgi:orotidine-5'-phosphate decarboxylase
MPVSERIHPGSAFASRLDPAESARQRLIVALDVPDAASSAEMVSRLGGLCTWFKVGMELFTAAGPAVLEPILKSGHRVFLDLKFHDIPNTVAGAVRSAAGLGVHMMTVHASGGPAMLAAAKLAIEDRPDRPELLAVTVLTSMDFTQLNAVGIESTPLEQAETLGMVALNSGYRGFVCSSREVARLRAATGPDGILAVPGIRPAGADSGDQKRIATPGEALRQGASYLVVGRPIIHAHDPVAATEGILQEMAEALGAKVG